MGNEVKKVKDRENAKKKLNKVFEKFYQFMNDSYKFEKICCVCLTDENNVYFEDTNIEKDYSNNYSDWKTELFSQIEKEGRSTIKSYIFTSEECKHFYHKSCKPLVCQFCKYGFSIENAYNFCLMSESDFKQIIYHYIRNSKINIKSIEYKKDLLNAVYNSIYNSNDISYNKKEKIKEKQLLESKFKESKFKDEDFEIPFDDSLSDWNNKYNKLLEAKERKKNRPKKEIEESDYYNDDSPPKSSSSKKKGIELFVPVCQNCSRRCFICGKEGLFHGRVMAHSSCFNEETRRKKLCEKCNVRIGPNNHSATYCSNCTSGKNYCFYQCYFCKEKLK